MSDLVGNPEARFSRVEAQSCTMLKYFYYHHQEYPSELRLSYWFSSFVSMETTYTILVALHNILHNEIAISSLLNKDYMQYVAVLVTSFYNFSIKLLSFRGKRFFEIIACYIHVNRKY